MNNSNDYAQRTSIITPTPSPATQDDVDYKNRRMEVWRPFEFIKPCEGKRIIVRTKNNSCFVARYINGQVIRHKHQVDIPVAEPNLWIYEPYTELSKYMWANDANANIPLELAFAWLLREKHELDDIVRKHPDNDKTLKDLQSSFQRSEAKNASLIEVSNRLTHENHELQQLVAQRNDELTKADTELEQSYATIADLKHKLKEADATSVIAYKHRIKELSEQITSLTKNSATLIQENNNLSYTAKARKQHINDLEKEITELKKRPDKPTITLSSDTGIQYLAKYNLLSTRYTKLRHLFQDITNRCRNLSNEGNVMPLAEISTFVSGMENINKDAQVATIPAPNASTDTSSSDTAVKPRRVTIPRSNFLRIPHIGEATLTLIEPLLNRFHVFLS